MLNRDHQNPDFSSQSDQSLSNFRLADKDATLDYYIEVGDKYLQQEDITEAIAYYRQAVQIDPKCLKACQKLATALKQQGNLEAAAGYLYQAIQYQEETQQTPGTPEKAFSYSDQILSGKTSPDVALSSEKLAEPSIILEPEFQTHQRFDVVSKISFESEDGVTVVHDVSEFIEPSQWRRKLTTKPQIQKNSTEEAAARQALKKALDYLAKNDYRQALMLCQRVINRFPNLAEAYKTKGNILQKSGQLSQAIECYQKAIEIDPNYTEVHANLGGIYAQQKQWKKSIVHYQKAIDLNPKFAGAYRNLAKVWYKLGRNQKAIEYTYQALKLEPEKTNPQIHYKVGNELLNQNRISDAIQCYEYAVKLNPQFVEAYQKLAMTLEKQGEWKKAASLYRRALELTQTGYGGQAYDSPTLKYQAQPKAMMGENTEIGKDAFSISPEKYNQLLEQPTAKRLPSYVQQSQQSTKPISIVPSQETPPLVRNQTAYTTAHIETNEQQPQTIEQKIGKYTAALITNPNSATLNADLGSLYGQKQCWKQAIRCYQKAIAINPQFAGVYRNLARIFEQTGKEKEATKYWFEAFSLEPEQASAKDHWELGNKLLEQGEIEESTACYRQAIIQKSDYTEAYHQLGKILVQQKQLDRAIACYRQAVKQNSQDSQSYYSLGRILAAKEDWKSVTICYERSLTIEPNQSQAYHYLGEAYIKQQLWEKAVASYKKAIRLDPEFSWSYHNLGDALRELKQWDLAVQSYREAIRLNPDCDWSYYNIAEALAALENWEDAYPAYAKAQKLNANLPELTSKLNHVLHQRIKSDLNSALKLYLQAIKQEPSNLDNYHQALKIDPLDTNLYLGLSQNLITQERQQDAIAVLEKSIEINPQFTESYLQLAQLSETIGNAQQATEYRYQALVTQSESGNVTDFLNLAKQFQAQEQFDKAETCYHQALSVAPEQVEPYAALGKLLIQQSHWDKAIQLYRQAITHHPSYTEFHFCLGEAHSNQQHHQEAIARYQQAIALDPDYWEAYHHQGDAWINLLAWNKAINCYEKVLELKPDFVWAYHNIALAYSKLERWSEAEKAYQQVTEVDPNFWEEHQQDFAIQSRWGDVLFHQEQWSQAAIAYKRSIQVKPEDFWCHHNLGKALYSLQQWDESIQAFESAVSLNNECPVSYYYLGELYTKAENWEKAVFSYRQTFNLQPDFPDVQDKLSHAFQQQAKVNLADARQYYRSKIAENPQDITSYRKMLELSADDPEIHYGLGKALVDIGRIHEGSVSLHKAIELKPNHTEASLVLGEVLMEQNRWSEAIELYRTALETNPQNQQINLNLGAALFRFNQIEEAIEVYSEAIKLNPNNHLFYYRLGDTLAHQGKTVDASNYYRKAVELETMSSIES